MFAFINRYLLRLIERLIESLQTGIDTAKPFPMISSLPEPDLIEHRNTRNLVSGCWRYSLQGFCMGIGRAGPVRGSLYEVARINTRSDLSRLLQGLADRPDVSREDGQRLLWSLQSRTPLTALPRDLQRTAEQVCPGITLRAGIRLILIRILQNLVSRAVLRLEQYLPAQIVNLVRSIHNVSTEIRANLPYQALERLAMADPPPDLTRDAREQWLMSSAGYYIKLLPNNYRSATMLVRVPPRLGTSVTRDAAGRIILISQNDGASVRWVYGDLETVRLDGNKNMSVWQLRRIELSEDNHTFALEHPGWVPCNIKALARLDPSMYPSFEHHIRLATTTCTDSIAVRKFIGHSGSSETATDALMAMHLLAAMRTMHSAAAGTGNTDLVTEETVIRLTSRFIDGLADLLLDSMNTPRDSRFVPEQLIGLPGDLRQQRMGMRLEGKADDLPCGEALSWSDVNDLFARGSTAQITDVRTGRSFNVKRWGGRLHADVEPATAADTRTLREIYGGEFSWDRRPIVVTIDGRQIAGSMHGMPHGGQSITDNDYVGHHCLHFQGSSTHKTGRPDDDHQAAVEEATCN